MKYELSDHARTVIRERDIPPEWIEQVLHQPQKIEDDSSDTELEHRLGQIKQHGGRVLRVIINKTDDPIRVVTVYFDRAMRKRL